jgi:hypothetical protein
MEIDYRVPGSADRRVHGLAHRNGAAALRRPAADHRGEGKIHASIKRMSSRAAGR